MKTKLLNLIGLLVISACSGHASQSESPRMNGKLKVTALSPEEIRYTGKPYSKELGAYVFNYRNFDPEISRWTTSDASGFPDGANNQIYSPVPTSQIDYMGAFSLIGNTNAPTSVSSNNYTAYGESVSYIGASASSTFGNNLNQFQSSTFQINFTGNTLAGTVSIGTNTLSAISSGFQENMNMSYSGSNTTIFWIQFAEKDLASGSTIKYLPDNGGGNTPWANEGAGSLSYGDNGPKLPFGDGNSFWAETFLATKTVTTQAGSDLPITTINIYDGAIGWGFNVSE